MGRITRSVKGTVKPFINVSAWMGLDFIKSSARNIKNMLANTFVARQSEVEETFAESLARLNLTEQDVLRREKEFTILAFAMSGITLVAVCYLLYLVFSGHWKGSIACIGVVTLSSSLAFRYHFWRFQIQQRRLGCSFREWFKEGLLGKKQ